MRKLTFVVGVRRGSVPVLVTATLLGAEGCGATKRNPEGKQATVTGATGDAGGTTGTGGASSATGAVTSATLSSVASSGIQLNTATSTSGADLCLDGYTVELPDEGVPAEPGQICSQTVGPVDANGAARVTLDYANSYPDVTGRVELAGGLMGNVVGTPLVEVIDASDDALRTLAVSDLVPIATGYAFLGTWGNNPFPAAGFARLTFRVTLDVDCPEGAMIVHSVTEVHLCTNGFDEIWVSSGDLCRVCRIIAEMAPSPIVPAYDDEQLPLGQALRLRVVELARISNAVLLLAENDGGEGLAYEWHANVGRIEELAPDVICWHLEEGQTSPMMQAAVFSESAAAVATFAFNQEAA